MPFYISTFKKGSSHSRFFLLFLLGFLFVAGLWIRAFSWQLSAPTESSRWIHECVQQKLALAEAQTQKKILIVSGSNALFGISARQLSEELQMPAVNLATHAALDIRYILHYARQAAKPGDIVLLPLEYELYDSDGTPNEVLIDYLASRDKPYLRQMPWVEQAKVVFGMKWERLAEGIRSKRQPPLPLQGGYEAATLNAWGDETINRMSSVSAEKWAVVEAFAPSKPLSKGLGAGNQSFAELERFLRWCRERNITVWASYPNLIYKAEYEKPRTQKTLLQIEQFWRQQGVPVLGTAQEYMYPVQCMYDTPYHLNEQGRKQRTQQLSGHIRQQGLL